MTDDQKNIDDVPAGFTLIDPNAPATPATTGGAAPSDVPAGFTLIPPSHEPNTGGVLQNPGGELPNLPPGPPPPPSAPTGEFSSMAPHIPPEQKSLVGFGANVLRSTKDVLENVGKAIIPLDAKNFNDAIPLKRASDQLFDLFYGAGRENARLSGRDLPDDEQTQQSDQAVDAFREHILNNYGSIDKFKEAFYHDPAGVASDLSVLFSGGSTAARALGLERLAKTTDTLSHVTNPLYGPSKLVSWPINKFAPKLPGAFDPREVSFGEATGTTPVTPPAAPPEAAPIDVEKLKQEAIVKRAQDLAQRRFGTGADVMPGREEWLQAEDEIRKSWKPPQQPKPPKPALAPKPTAAAPPPEPSNADKVFNFAKKNAMAAFTSAGVGFGLEGLTHNLAAKVATGALSYAALKGLPAVLKSAQGQEILSRLAKGSNAAAVASVARDLVPMLNAMQRQTQPETPIDLSQSPYIHAQGGAVNHELARVQRERLPLRSGTIRSLQRPN